MGRCALLLSQGNGGSWSLKRQYDKVAGYCHLQGLDVAKIYIDPTTLPVTTLQQDAKEYSYRSIIVADGSVFTGLVDSRPSLDAELQRTGLELLVVTEWETERRRRTRRQEEAS